MRVAGCVVSLVAASACNAWSNQASFAPTTVPDHVLVVTTRGTPRALELEDAHSTGLVVTGTVVRRWRVPDGTYEIDHLEDQDPDGVATILGWEPEPNQPREETSLATADIAYARAYTTDGRRAVKTLTYVGLGVAAIAVIVWIATLPPPAN